MNNKKTVLVIGGGRGIGKAVSLRCASEGNHIIVNYRSNTEEAKKTVDEIVANGGTAELCQFDITRTEETTQALDALLIKYKIQSLVFCAGIRRDELLIFMSEENWNNVIDTNLRSFYAVVKPVVKQMLLARDGRIVIVSSTSGESGVPGQVHYSASKAGLIGAVKALAQECAKRNVLVNAVTPGFIETEMTEDINTRETKSRIPMQRFGKATEVASVISFLLSCDSSYVTGQVIGINGGIYM